MASTRELRRKIKSITGTQKLTAAMQLISAAKMNRAIQKALASRTYSKLAWSMIETLIERVGRDSHPLLAARTVKTVAIVVITANRGLAGALNAQILRQVVATIRERKAAGQTVKIISLGRKGTQFFARHFADDLVADFPTPDTVAGFSDILDVTTVTLDRFLANEYDEIVVAWNEFTSTLKQTPIVRTLLPVSSKAERPDSSAVGKPVRAADSSDSSKVGTDSFEVAEDHRVSSDVTFEPSQARVLEVLLPRAVRTQLYQQLLDANASEHAARMLAMKNATDNAGELIDDLTLTMNGVRQAGITQEISEISAGAEALRSR